VKKILIILLFLPGVLKAQTIITIAGTGVTGYKGDNGPATACKFYQPTFLCIDASGNLLISDYANNVIRKINNKGVITTIAGTGTEGYKGDNGLAISAELGGPIGIAVDAIGNIYFSDFDNQVIRKINTSGIISTIAGTGVTGYSGDNGPAIVAKLYGPYGIAIDETGNIYFPEGENHCVRKITSSGIITTIAGNGTFGFSGDNGPATKAEFKYPGGIALGSGGDIYVSDYANHVIRKINATGIITTFAGTGTVGNTGDNGAATNAELWGPNGVYVDKEGNIYVTDNYANVVRKINSSGIITTIAGNGTQGYSGDNGPATTAQLYNPNDIAINGAGNIFIAEVANNIIRKITYHPEGVSNVNNTLNEITIYPNPAHNTVTIKAAAATQKDEVIITNTIGQQIYKQPYRNREIDISSYAAGIYFVKVGGVYEGRFVKE
jgi:sugar lactone lactonase YvrE